MMINTASRHVFFNPNPSKTLFSGDCVVRAICKALDAPWEEVFQDLCFLGLSIKRMPNDHDCYRTFLFNAGYSHAGISTRKGSKRPTVESFAATHQTGTYILEVAHHLVTVQNGMFYDTYDCGQRCLYGYWYKAHS